MRWPLWTLPIAGVALMVVAANLFLVFQSTRKPHALVRRDYYAAGFQLDAQRRRENGFDALGLNLSLREIPGALILETRSPVEPKLRAGSDLGEGGIRVLLQRRDDPAADRIVDQFTRLDSPRGLGRWEVKIPPLRRGKWICRAWFFSATGDTLEKTVEYFSERR